MLNVPLCRRRCCKRPIFVIVNPSLPRRLPLSAVGGSGGSGDDRTQSTNFVAVGPTEISFEGIIYSLFTAEPIIVSTSAGGRDGNGTG